MKAVILCAGRGTRLQPLTDTTPKTLLVVHDKPIIKHILDNLPGKISEVFIVVDYLAEQIIDYINEVQKDYLFNIKCVQQNKEIKGTLAALFSVKPFLSEKERFLVLNGDDLISRKDFEKMLEYQLSFGIQKMIMPNYYKVVRDNNGFLDSFESQNEKEKQYGVYVATGTYIIDTDIFSFPYDFLKGNEIGIPQTLLKQKKKYPLRLVEFSTWVPINTIEDFSKINNKPVK